MRNLTPNRGDLTNRTMDWKQRAIDELNNRGPLIGKKFVVAGLDGFVDKIAIPVALRQGQGEQFTAISTIEQFGNRVLGAVGKSTNIELYPRLEKLGGNGPIMAQALLAAGAQLKYIGALGAPHPHPVLAEFAARSEAVSLCDPGMTTAVEFTDGKLMLGMMASLDRITYDSIVNAVGGPSPLRELLGRADLLALVNWTMIPNMTAIFRALTDEVLPTTTSRERRMFFDLADPEKRSDTDVTAALQAIARFEKFGRVTLGLNLKEAQHVARVLGTGVVSSDEQGLRSAASALRKQLSIDTVVLHPRESAACATPAGDCWVPGPLCENPFITTGAGDHFNAGFSLGQLAGVSPTSCLAAGVYTSGYYVRTGRSPTQSALRQFIATGEVG